MIECVYGQHALRVRFMRGRIPTQYLYLLILGYETGLKRVVKMDRLDRWDHFTCIVWHIKAAEISPTRARHIKQLMMHVDKHQFAAWLLHWRSSKAGHQNLHG